ncbi:MAG: YlxR family protein [Mogibacterium sp.]|nr:YlxR family protein [Mogibacterium sp.]
MRKCIGCQQSRPQSELMRFTVREGNIIPDAGSKSEGRGIYLCRSEECFQLSIKRKAWNRILKCKANTDEIQRAIETALNSN